MSRFGHTMLTNMLETAQKVNKRCPNQRQHPAWGNRYEDSRQHRMDSRALQVNPCSHRRPNTRRSRQDDRILIEDVFYDETTHEKLEKKKMTVVRWKEIKYFEVTDVYKKVSYVQTMERTARGFIDIKWVDVKKADGRHKLKIRELSHGIDQEITRRRLLYKYWSYSSYSHSNS